MKYPKWVHRKTAKGKEYFYFNTGKVENGKPILTKLPPLRDPKFGGAYARAVAARTNRDRQANVLNLEGLIYKYQKSPEFVALAANTKRSYYRYLEKAASLIRTGKGQSPPAADITARDVQAMRDKLSDNPGAASQAVRAIGALYSWAVKPSQEYAKINPADGVSRFKSKEHEPWPEDLLEEALADPQVGMAVALFYFTGQRINEVVKMQRSDIHLTHMSVYVQKTKAKIRVAILPELRMMLNQVEYGDVTTILRNANGQPWSQSGLRGKLQAWAKERGYKVVPHGLRKNAVNSLFEAGCTAAEVSGITDQSIQMLEHYAKGRNKLALGQAAVVKLEEHRRQKNNA